MVWIGWLFWCFVEERVFPAAILVIGLRVERLQRVSPSYGNGGLFDIVKRMMTRSGRSCDEIGQRRVGFRACMMNRAR
jgi:hypothetical protein